MALNPYLKFHSLTPLSTHSTTIRYPASISNINFIPKHRILSAISKDPNPTSEDDKKSRKSPKSRRKPAPKTTENPKSEDQKPFPATIPRKPRRGRRSEAAAVEDFMRSSLEETFAAIREQNSEVLEGKESVIRERIHDEEEDEEEEEEEDEDDDCGDGDKEMKKKKKGMVVEEEDPNWPLDADVGWGIRASEYFEKHPIKNVIGEDGVEIDWEGELDDNLVKEINCLECESFAFHPSPLIVLVFERYNRASDNWRALKELEKAAKVYWNAKDRLPPRTVKLDMNIETDLAYALKIRECPQLLFLRGNRIIYREPQIRTADELVQMIAHFYYKARKPSILKDAILYS